MKKNLIYFNCSYSRIFQFHSVHMVVIYMGKTRSYFTILQAPAIDIFINLSINLKYKMCACVFTTICVFRLLKWSKKEVKKQIFIKAKYILKINRGTGEQINEIQILCSILTQLIFWSAAVHFVLTWFDVVSKVNNRNWKKRKNWKSNNKKKTVKTANLKYIYSIPHGCLFVLFIRFDIFPIFLLGSHVEKMQGLNSSSSFKPIFSQLNKHFIYNHFYYFRHSSIFSPFSTSVLFGNNPNTIKILPLIFVELSTYFHINGLAIQWCAGSFEIGKYMKWFIFCVMQWMNSKTNSMVKFICFHRC